MRCLALPLHGKSVHFELVYQRAIWPFAILQSFLALLSFAVLHHEGAFCRLIWVNHDRGKIAHVLTLDSCRGHLPVHDGLDSRS